MATKKSSDVANIKTAPVLAFERKLDVSDGLMYAGAWANQANLKHWAPINLTKKAVRGTISNRLKAKDLDPTKLDAKIESPNLQTVHVASLPANCDTLAMRFTLKVLGRVGLPSACSSAAYQAKLATTVASYVAANGFGELAKRYAANLANGRFLWRNRVGAEQVTVVVNHVAKGESKVIGTFDALAHDTRHFNNPGAELQALGQLIADGLSGKAFTLLDVQVFARMGSGQEVFPSQELVLEKAKNAVSRVLYEVNGVVGMHSQKIGNALRTIDDWYPEAEELGPIAAEPYGAVTTQGKAYRQPKEKIDFYSLLDEWVLRDKIPSLENQHFVMAILVRGGVFGDSESE